MKKMHISLMLIILFSFVFNNIALSWDNNVTHKDLSQFATENSVLSKDKGDYLKNLGFEEALDEIFKWGGTEQKIKKWIAEGAYREDAGTNSQGFLGLARYNNHFHNPLKPWGSAGLNDLGYIGESTIFWAQYETWQASYPEGDWSWKKARDSFYSALTSRTDTERQTNFVQTFRGLGHQMHLIQDMSVPAHVRNDAHPEDSLFEFNRLTGDYYFETWAKKYYWRINPFASTPKFPSVDLNISRNSLAPISQFIDAEQYNTNAIPSTSLNWGLSEYTNSNFVSTDTIFTENFTTSDKHYFPYPRYVDQNQCYEQFEETYGVTNKKRTYWRKKCLGEPVDHFVTAGPLFKYLRTWDLQRLDLRLDEATHNDYASKLIPRAVGYSAGLLNYFFRGDIDIIPDETAQEKHVIVNKSDEDMDGTFELWYDDNNEQRKRSWSGSYSIGKKSSENNKSSSFTIDTPGDAKEPGKYMLVFRGKLGAEEDAVAGEKVEIKDKEYVFLVSFNNQRAAFEIITANSQYRLVPAPDKNISFTRWDMPSTLLTIQSHPNKKEHMVALPSYSYDSYGNMVTTYSPDISKYGRKFPYYTDYLGYVHYAVTGFPNAYIPKDFTEGSPFVWDSGLINGESLHKTQGYYTYDRAGSYIHGRRPFSIIDNKLVAKNITIRKNAPYTYSGDDYSGPFHIQYQNESGQWFKSIDLPYETYRPGGNGQPIEKYTYIAFLDKNKTIHIKNEEGQAYKLIAGNSILHTTPESTDYSDLVCDGQSNCSCGIELYGEERNYPELYNFPLLCSGSESWGFTSSSIIPIDYDHMNGDDFFIVFFEEKVSSRDQVYFKEMFGDYGDCCAFRFTGTLGQNSITSAYYLIYKLNSSELQKIKLTESAMLNDYHNNNLSISGARLTGISSQINDKNMVYTYIVERYDNNKWVFYKRIAGIINISDESLPIGYRQEFELDFSGMDFDISSLAAIGVTK